jgi:hypothetical protein
MAGDEEGNGNGEERESLLYDNILYSSMME